MAKNCKTCLNELIPLCAAQYGMSKECEAWQPKKVMEKPEARAEVVSSKMEPTTENGNQCTIERG